MRADKQAKFKKDGSLRLLLSLSFSFSSEWGICDNVKIWRSIWYTRYLPSYLVWQQSCEFLLPSNHLRIQSLSTCSVCQSESKREELWSKSLWIEPRFAK